MINQRTTRLATVSIILYLTIIFALPVISLLATQDYPGSASFYGLQEDHWFVDLLFTLINL